MKRVNFYFTDEEVLFLQKQSEKTGLPMSDILRRLLDKEMERWETINQQGNVG